MNTKILLVDDEKDIVEFLQYNLENEGFEVISAHSGSGAINKLEEKPDLIILDVMMPDLDGYEVCKQIRANEEFKETPIIFLTAKSGEIDEIKGLNLGADDFIQKPISPSKLIARVKSNLRKTEAASKSGLEENIIKFGPIEINKEKYLVHIDGKHVILPKKEFEILSYLAGNPGRVFSRDKILADVWGANVFVVERTIDVHVRKIREKLGKHSGMIETVKGVGYKFIDAE